MCPRVRFPRGRPCGSGPDPSLVERALSANQWPPRTGPSASDDGDQTVPHRLPAVDRKTVLTSRSAAIAPQPPVDTRSCLRTASDPASGLFCVWRRGVDWIVGVKPLSHKYSPTPLRRPGSNEMIDVATARTIAMHTQLPPLIFVLLTGVALVSGVLAGYAMAKRSSRSWLHMVLYAAVIAVTIYAVLDLEYPRFGLIRLDTADKALLQLRDSMPNARQVESHRP
jgi:hypothetical protein